MHQYFATPQGWGSVRTYEFGRRLAAAGHQVDVLCCAAYDDTLAGKRQVEIGGLRVLVSRTRYRPQMGFLARLNSFCAFAGYALAHVWRQGGAYDLIIASSGPLTLALPALVARRLHGTPFVFETIDVWPDAAIAAGVLRNRWLQWAAFRLEARAYRCASRIVTCSTGMTRRVLGKGVPPGKVLTISNGCDLEVFCPEPAARAAARAALGVRDGQFVVLYTGAMGRSNAVDDLVQTAHALADDPRFFWCLAGDGAEADRLRRLPGRFQGRQGRAGLVPLFQAADAALVTFHHDPFFEENSPNKFFDAMAAGLPAIFNRSTWLGPEIAAYGCGFVCGGERPAEEMAARLRQLADDPGLRQRMGAAARRLAEERYSRDRLAEEYRQVLQTARS
jgi:glycosyltransferase involved in cell wall biosynthesis